MRKITSWILICSLTYILGTPLVVALESEWFSAFPESIYWYEPTALFRDRFWDVEKNIGKLPNGKSVSSLKGSFQRPLTAGQYTFRAMEPRDISGSEIHRGPDIQGQKKPVDVYCPAAGTVKTISYSSSYGNFIEIQHDDGVWTLYAHLSDVSVSIDSLVVKGQKIAETGNTGQGSGYHLHFEIFTISEGRRYYLYPAGYFLGSSGEPDFVSTPYISHTQTMSVRISTFSLNTPFTKIEVVYRDSNVPSLWYTAQMTTNDPVFQTTRTYTWTRPSFLDNKIIELYIAGRYWEEAGSDTYKLFVATRPAGGFKLTTKDSPLELEANPGNYYTWLYPGPDAYPPYEENNSMTYLK